ncbi:hypothetical protein BaOVIS_023130 [Babesia ovis]|uniref:Uncharacterized protein n=1 Tax=Babesia ovis TaxID=5869 RepID=A0A9W5TEN7_BABOV|nr:hypothetical protein BaOVIS_023130 [Babesia ovis]
MVNTGITMSSNSPLGCCKPKDERRNVAPVFRQQFINDNGKMKLTMPVSPLHYITSSTYYANDHRIGVKNNQWDGHVLQQVTPQVPYPMVYEQQVGNTGSRGLVDGYYVQRMENAPNKRMQTPNLQLVTQPQYRQASAQVSKETGVYGDVPYRGTTIQQNYKVELTDVVHFLARIEDRLKNVEILCKTNKTELERVNSALYGNQTMQENNGMDMQRSLQENQGEYSKLQHPDTDLETYHSKVSASSETLSNSGSNKSSTINGSLDMDKQNSMPSMFERISNSEDYGSRVFDVSQELRNSNDMIEKFLSGNAESEVVRNIGFEHENMEFSMTVDKREPLENLEHEYQRMAESLKKYPSTNSDDTSVKPIVTTSTSDAEEINNMALANLGKRFQMLMSSLEKSANEAVNGNIQVKLMQQGDFPNAANNSNPEQFGVNETQSGGTNLLALSERQMNDGALVLADDRSMALMDQQMNGGILVVPGDRSMALPEDQSLQMPTLDNLTIEQYRPEALKRKRESLGSEGIENPSDNNSEDSQNHTYSMLPEEDYNDAMLERIESIR